MPSQLPPPRNWQDFEDLCFDLFKRIWNDPYARPNGRSGQPQAGVDIYGQPDVVARTRCHDVQRGRQGDPQAHLRQGKGPTLHLIRASLIF